LTGGLESFASRPAEWRFTEKTGGQAMPRPLKIGLIGTGFIARSHLQAFSRFPERVQLTAVCDSREEAAREFAGEAKVDTVYLDPMRLLREADVDAVDICTPNHLHAPITIAAAEVGKHVLLEKPMAITMQECREMVEATEKAGVTFMVAQQLRYLPNYRGVRRLIGEGELGRIWGARTDTWLPAILSRSAPTPGSPQPGEQVRWRLDVKRSGGVSLIDNAIHFIDLFRYLIGDARRVFGTCWTDHPLFAGGAEDRAMATIEFENGAIAHVSNSWTTRTPWVFQWMILGDEGSVYTPIPPEGATGFSLQEAPAMVSSAKRDQGSRFALQKSFVPVEPFTEGLACDNSYANEIVHFAECCQEGREPISSGRDNLGTMAIIFGIYESSRTGGMVDISSL